MVFAWHFLIALLFTVLLYLGATYSSLWHLIVEIHEIQDKIANLQKQDLPQKENQLLFYKNLYNKNVADFNHRKQSPFAYIVVKLFKKLQQNFTPLP